MKVRNEAIIMINIDYRDKRPIYEQVIDKFKALILSGGLEADDKLPSVRALAIELSINPNTIQRAYSELEREGFIYSVKGRGNFVKASETLITDHRAELLDVLAADIKECVRNGILADEIQSHVTTILKEVQR